MAEPEAPPRADLYVPDRFEGLRDAGSGALRTIVTPVTESLLEIDARFTEMSAARRGSLMILRGETGAGKSTFLDTIGLFRRGVISERIPPNVDVAESLHEIEPTTTLRVLILEGREALGQVSAPALESSMHAINAFVRSDSGRNTIVVWPTNTDDLTEALVALAEALGREALFGIGTPVTMFTGPAHSDFVSIAERTVAALNEGASLSALGISESAARELAEQAETIGRYLALMRQELISNGIRVKRLLAAEQFRLWTVVIAGNDTEGDVAALTRGGYAYADIDRLLTATGANVVKDLRRHPDQLGILGTVLDAKILNMDIYTILAVARQFGDGELHAFMKNAGMSVSPDVKASDRLRASELGLVMAGESLGTRRRGIKPGGGTQAAFLNLAKIARTNDGVINRAIGAGLQQVGLISEFETERDLGTELSFFSDLYCVREGEPVRLEIMWRSTTSRAEIANYVLGKLNNYGRAIGLLES